MKSIKKFANKKESRSVLTKLDSIIYNQLLKKITKEKLSKKNKSKDKKKNLRFFIFTRILKCKQNLLYKKKLTEDNYKKF
jgi:hypothetical protein